MEQLLGQYSCILLYTPVYSCILLYIPVFRTVLLDYFHNSRPTLLQQIRFLLLSKAQGKYELTNSIHEERKPANQHAVDAELKL